MLADTAALTALDGLQTRHSAFPARPQRQRWGMPSSGCPNPHTPVTLGALSHTSEQRRGCRNVGTVVATSPKRLTQRDSPAHPSAAQAVPALAPPQQRLRNTGAALARSVSACAMSRGFHPPKCAHSQSQPGRSLSPTLGPARSMGGDHRSPGPPPKRLTNRPGRCRRQGAVLGPSALFATANQ